MVSGNHPRSWLSQISDDFRRLAQIALSKFASMPDPSNEPRPWFQLVIDTSSWPEFLVKIFKITIEQRKLRAVECPQLLLSQQANEFACQTCGAAFPCEADLKTHCYRLHGYKSPSRFYVPDTNVCLCCLTHFGSRDAVVAHHLWYGKPYLVQIMSVYKPMDPKEVDWLDEQARKKAKLNYVSILLTRHLGLAYMSIWP